MSEGRRKIINGNLNEQQEAFCQLFVGGDKEFFGNGVQSYLEIYDIDRTKRNWYKTACNAASRLLGNVRVCERIRELLEKDGFNEENVTKQHLFLINQFSDLGVKQRALADYYKLKGKYEPDKITVQVLDKEEVKKRIENLKRK